MKSKSFLFFFFLCFSLLVMVGISAIQCIMQKRQYSYLSPTSQSVGWKMAWQVKLKTSLPQFVAEASINMSWKGLSHSVAFHLAFNLVGQLPANASSLLFLPDQAERRCGLNMSSQQQATSNLLPFASMVPINTLLAPRREATDSEGDRRGCDVVEKWSAWKRKNRAMRETEIEAQNDRK